MTLDGITLLEKKTPSGIGYYQFGEDNLPTVVYFHGIDQRGDGEAWSLPLVLDQGICARQWVNNGYNAWVFKEVFSLGFRLLLPQLPKTKSTWDIAYIDSFLDAVHTNQPLYLTGWSLGGGGVLRYMAQLNKKHKVTCFSAIASAIAPTTGENVKEPYFFAHSTNDRTVNVSNTDNYVAKIPNFDNTKYKRGNSGDHWYYLAEAYASRELYDWFKSFIAPPADITYTLGTIELGSDGVVYGNFNQNRIQLSLPK